MTHIFKKAFLVAGVLFALAAQAGGNSSFTGEPKASIKYNVDKTGTSEIEYNTSFFIFDLTMDEASRNTAVTEMLAADDAFKKLELMQVNGVKDMMVIIDVKAKNLAELTKKIKSLLIKLNVKQVDYNDSIVTTDTFSF